LSCFFYAGNIGEKFSNRKNYENKKLIAALAATGLAVFALKKYIASDSKPTEEAQSHHLTNAFSKAKKVATN
jgi:hypothetical protein